MKVALIKVLKRSASLPPPSIFMNRLTSSPPALFDESREMGDKTHRDLAENLHLNPLCLQCSTPLDPESVKCLKCGHRHGMTSCKCCGEPLFKHGATQVFKRHWRELSGRGSIFRQVVRWLKNPQYKETFYLHLVCAEKNPDLLVGAYRVTKAKKKYLPQIPSDRFTVVAPKQSHSVELPLNLVGDRDLDDAIHSERELNSVPEIDLVGELNQLSNFDDGLPEVQLPGVNEVFSTYQSGERDFSNSQLGGLSLNGQDLSGINLSSSDLRRSAWKQVNLSGVDLSGAIADNSRFENTNFQGGIFQKSSFRDVTLIASDLTQADFGEADLRRSDCYSSNFHCAMLTFANFSAAKLDSTDLSGACLSLATLSQASLQEANLEGATLENTDLRGANLSWAILKDVVATQVNLSDAVLQHADLEGIDLSVAQLTGTDFLHSNIEAASSLQNATYNDFTRFPDGFKPEAKGMIRM